MIRNISMVINQENYFPYIGLLNTNNILMLEHDGKPAYTILPFNFTYLNKTSDICELIIHKKEISADDVCPFQIFNCKNNHDYFVYKERY